ncbi:MAG TPA: twin-arginine translocase TatA/TatE family subunit [Anaerolineae bacterium]|nr:twin-arginine translocase TatA/TatE family subunit [Anaerolineae bacterium]HPL29330.1 twin-arginine translocase TatA/TatE family subunit [Anaerolineae bacterium]
MPFKLGAPELILILLIVVIVFGVGKLPEVGSALGRGIRDFKKGLSDAEEPEEAPESTTEGHKA